MRSTQVLALLAVLATSVSSLSIGHVPDQVAHRRHATGVHESVIQARGARRAVPVEDMPDMVRRDDAAPRRRKRGLNQRRCIPKTTTGLPQTTSAAPTSTSTSSAEPTSSAESSTTPEPEPTTSQATTTSTPKAKYTKTSQTSQTPTKTSTSAKPTATNDDDSGSSSGETFTGQATYYDTGLGACGITSKNTDKIVAVSQLLYDGFQGYTGSDPNSNPICGKQIKATYQGKSVTVTVVDRCVGCALRDLDFSPTAFDQLADQSLGRLDDMTWSFV